MKIVISIISIIAVSMPCLGAISGEGTKANPYRIRSFEDFHEFATDSFYWGSEIYAQLETDIDMNPNLNGRQLYRTAVIAGDNDASTGGFQGPLFKANFNGDGHVLSNITIDDRENSSSYLGLFGRIGSNGVVNNIYVKNCKIFSSSQSTYIGGLAGVNIGSVDSCVVSGNLNGGYGSRAIGGLLGSNDGEVNDCYAKISLTCGDMSRNIGGLIGSNHNGIITNSRASGNIVGGYNSQFLGGLVGYNWESSFLDNCYASCSVNSKDNSYSLGGLIGYNSYSDVNGCYAICNIDGGEDVRSVGGLIGYNDASDINGCFAKVDVKFENNLREAGGLLGSNTGDVKNSFSSGSINCENNVILLGGLIGGNNGNISSSFATTDINCGQNSEYIGGLSGASGSSIYNSYSKSSIRAQNASMYIGGLVGQTTNNTTSNCYAIGHIVVDGNSNYVGGLIGHNKWSNIKHSFWDVYNSGLVESDGGTGLTNAQMKTETTFATEGWDFVNVWDIIENKTYPFLKNISSPAPIAYNIDASQRTDGSRLIDIRYDLYETSGQNCIITIKVSSDGGNTWTVPATSFYGEIGNNVASGSGKLIVWDAGSDIPGEFGQNYKVEISATIHNLTGHALSNAFTVDNRTPAIVETQFNRMPAVIPQYSFSDPTRSTLPLKFAGEILASGTAPIDLGPLSITARINNPTTSNVKVKLKIKEYISPSGEMHTKLFNRSFSENAYFKNIGFLSSSDLSLLVHPPSQETGTWQVNLDLYQRKGVTSLSDEKIASFPLEFTVKNPDEPTVEYPDPAEDSLGNVLMPPNQISLSNTAWYVIYQNINMLGDFLGETGKIGASYSNYYEGLEEILENIRNSAILKVKPKIIGTDVVYNINWYHSIIRPFDFGIDRAVIIAYIPNGVLSSDLIDSGSAKIIESEGQIKALMWLINGVDKRIWQTSGRNRCEWISRDLSFKLQAESVRSKKVQFSLELQIGPFSGASLNYEKLSNAPWVYDYNKWITSPKDVFWYDIAVTDPVTIIDNSHKLEINPSLDYLLASENGSIFLPYECTTKERIVSWSDATNSPLIPPELKLMSAIKEFSSDQPITLNKPATISLPFDNSASEYEELGIFKWDAVTSNWIAVNTEIDQVAGQASTKITETGIYAMFETEISLPPIPEISLEFPVGDIQIQQHTPEFKWNDPVGNGWLYQIQIDDLADFISPDVDEICTMSNTILADWLEEKVYFWRVRRIDQTGAVSDWTDPASFLVAPDTTHPHISKLRPTDGSEITEGLPSISAKIIDEETAIDSSNIFMQIDSNDVSCQYDPFDKLVSHVPDFPFAPGSHSISILVRDIAGNENNISWDFTVSRYVDVKSRPFNGGLTVPADLISVTDSNELFIECKSKQGYKFNKWSVEPENAAIIQSPYSFMTAVNILGNATFFANFTKVEDFTNDGKVNFKDFSILCNYWSNNCKAPSYCNGVDLTQDGTVDIKDVTHFLNKWLYDSKFDIITFSHFAQFANWWMISDCELHNNCEGLDYNLDGSLDTNDLRILSETWLK